MPDPKTAPSPALSYDLGESPEAAPEEAVASSPSPADPPAGEPRAGRDPETGRFLPKAEQPKLPAHLLRQARDLGMAEDELADVPPEDLRDYIRDARLERVWRERVASLEQRPADPAPASPAAEADDDWGDFDPRIRKLAMEVRELRKENADLKEHVGAVRGFVEQREGETRAEAIDRAISQGGDPSRFGDSPLENLRPDSDEAKRRRLVWKQALDLAGDKASFRQQLAKVPEVLRLLGLEKSGTPRPEAKSEKAAEPAPRGPTPQEWAEAGVARPTQRGGSAEPYGVERAKRAVRELTREASANGGATSPDEFPG